MAFVPSHCCRRCCCCHCCCHCCLSFAVKINLRQNKHTHCPGAGTPRQFPEPQNSGRGTRSPKPQFTPRSHLPSVCIAALFVCFLLALSQAPASRTYARLHTVSRVQCTLYCIQLPGSRRSRMK